VNVLFAILAALLVVINAFFVIAEYALVRSSQARLEAIRDEGVRGANLALTQVAEIGDYIATCQVGITMASIGIGALGQPGIAHLLEGALGGGKSDAAAVAISVVIAYALIITAQSIVGEIVPKLYTIQHAERLAIRIAPPLRFFRLLFNPFILVLNSASRSLLRLIGTDPDAEAEGGTPEELKRLIAQSTSGGQIDVGEASMLTGVFHLHEQEARNVTEDENQDRVKGIVHVNQLVKLLMARGVDAHFDQLVREAPIVPETKPLDDLLAELQRERTELAIVIDEYGRTAGIVTIEDIIEEVVGEISDETDPAGGAVRRLANGDWFVRGHVAVSDLPDYGLELPVDTDAYNSVGGFVFAQLGRLPKRGDTIAANGYSIRVESVRQNRIEAVRIRQRGVRPSTPAA